MYTGFSESVTENQSFFIIISRDRRSGKYSGEGRICKTAPVETEAALFMVFLFYCMVTLSARAMSCSAVRGVPSSPGKSASEKMRPASASYHISCVTDSW